MSDPSSTPRIPTRIGIVSPGEMGVAIGNLLGERGYDVVATVAHRSARTVALAEASSIRLLPTLSAVVSQSDIIISTVTPDTSAELVHEIVNEYTSTCSGNGNSPLTFVDANSVAPGTARVMAETLQASGIDFVDAAIHGLSSRLCTQATIYVSGRTAGDVCSMFGNDVRTVHLGNEPGQASSMKMLLGGMSKGIIAQFLQSGQLASTIGVVDAFCEELNRYFPDVLSFVCRSLPTYPTHVSRRACEMDELSETLQQAGVKPYMASGAQQTFEDIAACQRDDSSVGQNSAVWLEDLIRRVNETNVQSELNLTSNSI